jgi:hypothetical protein
VTACQGGQTEIVHGIKGGEEKEEIQLHEKKVKMLVPVGK